MCHVRITFDYISVRGNIFEIFGGIHCRARYRPVSCKDPRMQLFLIAVTSWLDAVVACTNVLHVQHSDLCCG